MAINKVPFIAAVQTDKNGHPVYAVYSPIKTFSGAEIERWANKKLKKESLVVSDGLYCFSSVTNAGCKHERNVVGKGRHSTHMQCFNWVNTVLGNLKNSINGTYHSVKFKKYAHRYLAVAQYRFNRHFDMEAMFVRLLYASVQTEARSELWLRSVG